MVGVLIHLDDAQVELALEKLSVTLSFQGLSAFLGGVVDPYLRKRISNRFASEGDDATGPWAPLRESTVGYRIAQGFPGRHPINRRTGELERFLTQNRGDIDFLEEVAQLTLPGDEPTGELFDKLEMAQTGRSSGQDRTSSAKAGTKRPVLKMNEADMLFVMAELAFFVEAGVS